MGREVDVRCQHGSPSPALREHERIGAAAVSLRNGWWNLRDRMARWWRRVRCWLLFEWHDPNAAGFCRRCDTYIRRGVT